MSVRFGPRGNDSHQTHRTESAEIQAPGVSLGRCLFILPNVRPEIYKILAGDVSRRKVIPGHSAVLLIYEKPRHEAQVVVSLDENPRVKILAWSWLNTLGLFHTYLERWVPMLQDCVASRTTSFLSFREVSR
ncbi:hypothetical protein Agabi119p4_4532 [Agaricus bisporus var. burnettii]|uniref:Uncharacterized protein n=1 Tax=Agaricus bisporus var. burnettii TaxID=192524 RepID=A0A8H7F3R3_AGABI|nr:hypothetical protein Agabi119p4_4532 [Agaricus bisporus var. burnettii]